MVIAIVSGWQKDQLDH